MVESDRERRKAPGCCLTGTGTGAYTETQIYDRFSGVSLSRLSGMGADEVAAAVSKVEVCPLCGGVGCAVRLGFTSGR